jgi:hypothetical protein
MPVSQFTDAALFLRHRGSEICWREISNDLPLCVGNMTEISTWIILHSTHPFTTP